MTRPGRGEPRARTKILEASRTLFGLRGFSETSVGDIARSAQVARATVYNNFDDKQDILAAIISEYMTGYARIAQRLRANARSGQTSFALIQEMVREALAWWVENADLQPIVAVARNLRGSGWGEASKAAAHTMIESVLSSFGVSARKEQVEGAAHQLALLHWCSICSIDPAEAPRGPLGSRAAS